MSNIPIPAVRPGKILHDCWHCGYEFPTRKTSGGLCGNCWPKWLRGDFHLGIARETYEVQCLKRTVAHLMDAPETALTEDEMDAEDRALTGAAGEAIAAYDGLADSSLPYWLRTAALECAMTKMRTVLGLDAPALTGIEAEDAQLEAAAKELAEADHGVEAELQERREAEGEAIGTQH